jgi:hypothetical protein
MMDRAWHHEKLEVRGEKLREFYQTPHLTVASGSNGVQNAPTGPGRVNTRASLAERAI